MDIQVVYVIPDLGVFSSPTHVISYLEEHPPESEIIVLPIVVDHPEIDLNKRNTYAGPRRLSGSERARIDLAEAHIRLGQGMSFEMYYWIEEHILGQIVVGELQGTEFADTAINYWGKE